MKALPIILRSTALIAMGLWTLGATAQSEDGPDSTKKQEVETIVIPVDHGRIEVKFVAENDTAKKDDKDEKEKKPKPRKFWSGIDFGFNGYLNQDMGTTMPLGYEQFDYELGRSTYWGFNLFEQSIPIYRTNVVLLTGLGIDYNSYRFRSKFNPFSTPDSLGNYQERDYVTNRLKTLYATVPLMLGLDFSKPNKKGLHLAFGVVGGVRIGSFTKEKYTEDNSYVKTKVKNDYNLNPFRVNAQVRLGYGNFTLIATYGLTRMFRDNVDRPTLHPYSLGISFGG